MVSHQPGLLSARSSSAGLSLVELLVAMLVTLIGLLVITQVFVAYEGWKRATTGVAQTQESGLLGAFAIEQDLRNAGFGMVDLECAKISAYNDNTKSSKVFDLSGSAVSIAQDTPVKGSDRISILYSSSPFANVATKIQKPMVTSASALNVDNGLGFTPGDIVLLAQDSNDCAILQVSDEPTGGPPNVTSPGNSWKLPHESGQQPWNPPEETDIFPSGGYHEGARVLNLGQQIVDHSYYVEDNTLRVAERSVDGGSVTVYDLVPGVMAMRAECLPGACNEQPTAIRFGLIVRSDDRQREQVEQREVSVVGGKASIAFWSGDGAPKLDIDDEMRHYRYRVFNTIVPLKNNIWNK